MFSDVERATVVATTEENVAAWRRRLGIKVFERGERYWECLGRGFYQPIALIEPLAADRASPSIHRALATRAALAEKDTASANGSIPSYLLEGLDGFDLHRVSSDRRTAIRKALRSVDFAQLTDPSVLWDQGYDVAISALNRRGRALPTLSEYRNEAASMFDDWHIIIAGFVGGKLAGYIDGFAIGTVGYGAKFYAATDALSSRVGSGLVYHILKAFGRSGQIKQMMNSLHSPENLSQDSFKRSFGFRVCHIPSRVRIGHATRLLMRFAYPAKLYRFAGDPSLVRRSPLLGS